MTKDQNRSDEAEPLEAGRVYLFRVKGTCPVFHKHRLDDKFGTGTHKAARVLRLSVRGSISNAGPEIELQVPESSEDGDPGWRGWFCVRHLTWSAAIDEREGAPDGSPDD